MTAAHIAAVLVSTAAGGALGGVLRYLLAAWSVRLTGRPGSAHTGTWTANVLACGLLGWAASALTDGSVVSAAVGVGLAGGLSTWSTLASEMVALLRSRSSWAVAYPLLTLAGGIGAAWVGLNLSQFLLR